jgi:hypothetical protein
MINVAVNRVDPAKVGQLREWLATAGERVDEVRQTLVAEGVRHEQALLVETSDGPLLVYVVESEDHEVAKQVFARSTSPIDVEHKKVMAEVGGVPVPVETLLDIRDVGAA